jgi:hypothetical protein
MHLGGSIEYQFAAVPLQKIMSDLVRVATSPSTEAMAAS